MVARRYPLVDRPVIYYFTGTGNSLVVARRLAKGLMTEPPEPMVGYLEGDVVPGGRDTVALVYPVHHWGPPDLVLRFASRLKVELGTYVLAVATYGNHSGRAFQDLDRALRTSAHGLTAGFHVRTVQNYVPVFPIPDAKTLLALQREADATVDRVIEVVQRRGPGEREHWRWRPGVRGYYLASKRRLHEKDRAFSVRGGCTSCGICVRVCPVGNVQLREGRPVWLHRCEQCFACLHWCPEGVIEWGGSVGMGRYHHPDVTVEDMEAQAGPGR